RTDRARAYWTEAGVGDRIEVRNGKGLEELPKLRGPFDLAFIDALKPEYEGYLAAVLPLLRSGGTVAVDNLLWGGRASGAVAVADPRLRGSGTTRGSGTPRSAEIERHRSWRRGP